MRALLGFAMLAAALLVLARRVAPASSGAGWDGQLPELPGPGFFFDAVRDFVIPWRVPDAAAPYLPALTAAEVAQGIPAGLLVRLAYQESRFRPEIISGALQSRAGAIGIMQIIPRFHPGVNPLDPAQAIPYAARYLRQQFDRFGSWELALAAYNWGPGNVAEWQAGRASPPLETRNYVAQITQDVQVA